MTDNINYLVEECLIQHEGGEKFFDAIDEKLRNDKLLLTMMIGKVLESENFDYIIVSGHFGDVFKTFCQKNFDSEFSANIIVTNGGLRNNNEVIPFWQNYDIKDKNIIFIDDSFYLGRTRDKIKTAIEKYKGKLLCTYVFYDGSKIKDESVHSFYRYYDHYNVD